MAVRFTLDELKFLRDSPLVTKPPGLPPTEQWMGPAADATRNSNKSAKSNDSSLLLDQARRPITERHLSRTSANPEDIILGPPRTNFMSATSIRNSTKTSDSPDRPTLRDNDSRDRYNFRNKDGESERNRGDRGNSLWPKRAAEGDQDSDGWTPVKPRKSFGTEGAERFNGRMGVDRHREERRLKERDERELKDKSRGFDSFSRDKDTEHDQERDSRRNGNGRGRNEPSWFKDRETSDAPPTPRDRNSNGDKIVDRSRGWREKERDENRSERPEMKEKAERGDRRWAREERQEREPEWMDEPVEEKAKTNQVKTAEDFQKWKEQMQGKDKVAGIPVEESKPEEPSCIGLEKQKVETPLEINNGPDKFFGMWTGGKEGMTPDEPKKEGIPKSKTTGKASRFTSFFTPHEEPQRRVTEPPPPPAPSSMKGGFGALFLGGGQSTLQDNNGSQSAAAEREAFQNLLQKLQHQTVSGPGSTPPIDISRQAKPPAQEKQRSNPIPTTELYQQYRSERQEEARPSTRNSQQPMQQEMMNQRQMTGSQPAVRPEQMLQDLVGQRHSAMSQPSRPDLPASRNSNTDFLMGLMQSARAAPDPQRSEQILLRMPPRTVDRQIAQLNLEREQEMQREAAQRDRASSQRQARPQPPPGFISYEEATAFQRGPPQHERQVNNPPQPTQILQRPPPPPGLDMGWERQPQLPPQHRIAQNIAPPPGLASGAPNRGMPMPQGIYPPGFMGGFPPPDVMTGTGPPRNMPVGMQPPPGFFNPPPPGFMPPNMTGFQGPVPEGLTFGAPFDARGPPPQGAFRRQ